MGADVPLINRLILISMLLCGVHFFGLYHKLSNNLYDLIDLYFFGVAFILMVKYFTDGRKYYIPRSEMIFSKPLLFLFLCLFLSSLSGYAYHGQSPLLALLAMRYFAYFLVYYLLVMLEVKKEDLIKLVLVFSVFYMFVFSLQLLLFPMAIVPLGHAEDFDRGFLRLRLEGVGFILLAGFYCLNAYLVDKKKLTHLVFYFLCFLFVYILGFRTLPATFLVASIMLVSIYSGTLLKNIVFMFCFLFFCYLGLQVDSVNMFFSDMLELTESQLDKGEDYIRFLTFNFLFVEVNGGVGSIIFGNGMPFDGTEYGNLVLGVGAKMFGFISADLGLIGFIFNFGLLSLLAFLNIFRIAIFKRLSKDNVYLSVFFLYLVISSITTSEIYRAGMFVVEAVGFYLITQACYEKNKLESV
ncbi:MAG: hypothetical protein RPR97_06000 [Colwellia sp.]|jgi:hypothetical protein